MDRATAWGMVEVLVDAMTVIKSAAQADSAGAKTDNTRSTMEPVASPTHAKACIGGARSTTRLHRDFLIQVGFMHIMWVWAMLLGVSYLLPHR